MIVCLEGEGEGEGEIRQGRIAVFDRRLLACSQCSALG
jgi:hypothetical protein